MRIINGISAQELIEIMVALNVPSAMASDDVNALAAHAYCTGHTVFLPDGGTMGVKHTGNGKFTVAV